MSRQTFIERHGLWSDDQRTQAESLKERVRTQGLRLIRLAWTDAHGYARAKAVTVPAFLESLAGGYNINVATTTLDSANARTFSSFTRGGGMGLDEMTGSPNITIVPDPATFRILPWAPGVGWVLCDEYFNDGARYHFSARHLPRQQLERLQATGLDYVVGRRTVRGRSRPVAEELMEALDALEQSTLFRRELGGIFLDYFLQLKRNEAGRFLRWLEEHPIENRPDESTAWEQNEYFDFF